MKSKSQKREEAIERQQRYDNLTTKEKIELIRNRKGGSKREMSKLLKRLREEERNKSKKGKDKNA